MDKAVFVSIITPDSTENQENEYLFIQNYARETKAVPVPAEYEVIYGAADEIMQPLATRVLKKKK